VKLASFLLLCTLAGTASAGQAEPDPGLHSAIRKSLLLLQRSAVRWTQFRDCFSCHHQGLGAMTVGLAREQSRFTVRHVRGQKNLIEQGAGLIGGPLEAGYALAALHADGRPADETTKALVMYLLRTHSWDGSWRIGLPHRPPLEDSDFAATALAIHGLQLYDHDDFRDVVGNRVKYATTWLAEAETRTLDDEVFRLMGLKWAGGSKRLISAAEKALIAKQRDDGGWAQLDERESDAFATGQTLVALHQEGGVAVDDEVYQRGVSFLLQTQRGNGSWFVESRDYPGRPVNRYFESGFPHKNSQFISYAGTCWATSALIMAATAN
jgi:hypothetical protein